MSRWRALAFLAAVVLLLVVFASAMCRRDEPARPPGRDRLPHPGPAVSGP